MRNAIPILQEQRHYALDSSDRIGSSRRGGRLEGLYGELEAVAICKGPILFDLVSYCDVRVQSIKSLYIEGEKRVPVECTW